MAANTKPKMKPMIGQTIERIRASVPLGSFLTAAIIPRINATGPNRIGKNSTETIENTIARVERVFVPLVAGLFATPVMVPHLGQTAAVAISPSPQA